MKKSELKAFLDEKYHFYNDRKYVLFDPISIPHMFSEKEDVEISAFLAATIAWGQRKTIIRNAQFLMQRMDYAPHEFITGHTSADLDRFAGFVHRTFNETDLRYFLEALKFIYTKKGGLEKVFSLNPDSEFSSFDSICQFREVFFALPHEKRTEKHVSNPAKGASAKRLNMFLRWMVREDEAGVDFGIWKSIPTSGLSIPLDVHTGNVSRKLGLLKRKQNDWKAVAELDEALKKFDPQDPVKYDFALFGLGAFEKF